MEILKYIKDEFKYIPMVKRIESLEIQVDMLNSRLTGLESRFYNDWEKQGKAQRASELLGEIIISIKPDIDYYKLQDLKDSLRRALE